VRWLVTVVSEVAAARFQAWLATSSIEAVTLGPPWAEPPAGPFDALLLGGGGDVDPRRYRQARHPATDQIDEARDALELRLVRDNVERGRPVFGVCRGQQVIVVALGGALIQHLPDKIPESIERHRDGEGGGDVVHRVVLAGGSRLCDALRGVERVNSSHHQAAEPDTLPASLKVAVLSPNGVVEAIESAAASAVISAVQWHPERLAADDPAAARLLAHWRRMVGRPG